PLSDGAGEIVEVGEGVTRVQIGERVATLLTPNWLAGAPDKAKLLASLGATMDGVLAEYILLSEQSLVRVPSHLSDEEAATLPCAALTAWSALITQGRLKPGNTVLVQGTGGVSLFALQFAKMAGARVIITSSSDEKLARARSLGADETINYNTTPDWDKCVKELTNGIGVDHVVDVGGAGTLTPSLRAVRFGGQISLIGVLAGNSTKVNLVPILMQNIRIQGVTIGNREMFEEMNNAIALHRLKPVVDRVFAFDDAREAFLYMASGAHFGKVCIHF
ncbi:MAG: NAD(P)-dependent alcohol dehydrogenase, partial [Acidobacteriota bacterium]